MLKRPSDSSSALSSVTPRDRLVYASGSVRSTASNNAPYKDRVRQSGRERHTHMSCIDAHVQELWQNSKRRETQKRRGHHFTLSNSRTSAPTGQHSEFFNKVHESVSVLFWKCSQNEASK